MKFRITEKQLRFLKEQEEGDEELIRLFHGTIKDNLESIKQEGLIPKVGDFVRDMYEGELQSSGINIDEDDNLALVFFADKKGLDRCLTAIKHMIARKYNISFHKVNKKMIEEEGLLFVIDFHLNEKDEGRIRHKSDDTDEFDDYGDYPITVEPGDYFTSDFVSYEEIKKVIYGQELIDFFNVNLNGVIKEEKIKGGLADNMSLEQIAKKHKMKMSDLYQEFKKGIKVEFEHTKDKDKAKEITKDHLVENPKYYSKLLSAGL